MQTYNNRAGRFIAGLTALAVTGCGALSGVPSTPDFIKSYASESRLNLDMGQFRGQMIVNGRVLFRGSGGYAFTDRNGDGIYEDLSLYLSTGGCIEFKRQPDGSYKEIRRVGHAKKLPR